jgi:predicted acyltransferase
VCSFLNLEKYPTSLQYLLMTLGPALILFAILEKFSGSAALAVWTKPLLVFGRVPLFFYVLHLYLIHLAAIALATLFHQPVAWLWHGGFFMNDTPAGYGHGLPLIYGTWCVLLVLLYFPCAWFAQYRSRHRSWWLSYL